MSFAAGKAGGKVQATHVESVIAGLRKQLASEVTVVQSLDELSPKDRAQAEADRARLGVENPRGIFMADGWIVLVADGMTRPQDAVATLLHEVTERGLDLLSTPEQERIVFGTLKGLIEKPGIYKAVWAKVRENYPGLDWTTDEGRRAIGPARGLQSATTGPHAHAARSCGAAHKR